MLKKLFSIIFTVILVFSVISTSLTASAYEVTGLDITVKAGMLVSMDTDEILYSHNIDKKMYPASLTKIMTVTLMLESDKYNPESKIAMTKEVQNLISGTGSAVSNFQIGEEITQLDLVYTVLMSSFGDFIALSDVCDKDTASIIKREVSDGVIAPGFTEEALEILKQKKKGNYVVIQIDTDYKPAPLEHKEVFGVTFEQGRQELPINDELITNIVTKNKDLPENAKRDMKIALITLKYTQSNSVCFVKDGQAIGVGAGQQSRVHCTRLAGQKADNWFLRQSPKVLGLQFADGIGRADRDNAIDVYIGNEYMDVLADGAWERVFKVKPEVFTEEEKKAWLSQMKDVTVGSDAFFPFSDNIERAKKSGVKYIAEPGGSVRDDAVIECCDKYGMAMAFTGIRLFHHYNSEKKRFAKKIVLANPFLLVIIKKK